MIIAHVSSIESFRRWKANDEPVSSLVENITVDSPSEPMMVGTALHKALEFSPAGEFSTLSADGVNFKIDIDIDIAVPKTREMRGYKRYGDLMVTGRLDAIIDNAIVDYKTTQRTFDPDNYLDGYQWRYYLDIFGLKNFKWYVFELKKMSDNEYHVKDYHELSTTYYDKLTHDCETLAKEYYDFADKFLPIEYKKRLLDKFYRIKK